MKFDKEWSLITLLAIVLLYLGCIISMKAEADTSVGLGWSQYTDQVQPTYHGKIKWGPEGSPLYVWGAYENMDIRILGQGVSDTPVFSLGGGVKKDFGDFWVFLEAGYAHLEHDPKPVIVQEVAYTDLVATHAVGGRRIPTRDPYTGYDSDWTTTGGITAGFGIGYTIGPHLSLTGGYRVLFVEEFIEIVDPVIEAKTGGSWRDTRARDMSAFEVTLHYTF